MPLTVRCPQCGKELVAPDELLGRIAACPGCQLQFPVTGSDRAVPARSAVAPPAPRDSWSGTAWPPGTSAPAGSAASTPNPGNVPPAASPPTAVPPPVARPVKSPANLPAAPEKPPAAASKQSPASPAAPATRTAQPARFITASPTEQRIDLGADGRLPELVLREGGTSESAPAAQRTNSPILLIAALAISFSLTVLLLVWNPESSRSESERQAAAQSELEQHYILPHRRLEPYQEHLRRALQFHNQKKYAEERQCYRRVLDLLHEEHRDTYKGLTGVRSGPTPPSDEHLESLLSQLLSNDR